MPKLAPLTKLILTVAVSIWALFIPNLSGQVVLAVCLLLLLMLYRPAGKHLKAVGALLIFAGLLAAIQYVFGSSLEFSLISGLRMFAMSQVFVFLLATTRLQDLTAALVSQCRIPYEYAFMFTSALRFVPDFLEESKAVREAQACRGYVFRGSPVKRLMDYVAIVEPLVLRAISRSETMAMSLELRGFGRQGRRQFTSDVAVKGCDYAALFLMASMTIALVVVNIGL